MKIFFSLALILAYCFPICAQKQKYCIVDSVMRNYNGKVNNVDDLFLVSYFIRKHFSEDSLRLRASLIWITENIKYDVVGFLNEDYRSADLRYVIRKKKAICSGYAALLKYFCDAFLIENEIIEGRARTGKKDINISRSNYFSDHAWNAVKVNNQWRLVDPTWSAGYLDDTNGNRPKFVKEYNDEYYFTAPEKLILNHFPKNDQFQFLEKKIDFKEFSKWPLYSSAFIKDSISNVVPNMALLKLSQGDTLTIKFQSPSMMTNICVTSEVKKAEYNGFSEYKDGWYEFHYPVTVIGFYNLHIGYCLAGNRFSLLSYKLQVDQKR